MTRIIEFIPIFLRGSSYMKILASRFGGDIVKLREHPKDLITKCCREIYKHVLVNYQGYSHNIRYERLLVWREVDYLQPIPKAL